MAGLMPQLRNPPKRRNRSKKSIPEEEISNDLELKKELIENNDGSEVDLNNDSRSIQLARNTSIANEIYVHAERSASENNSSIMKPSIKPSASENDGSVKGEKHGSHDALSSMDNVISINDTIMSPTESRLVKHPQLPIVLVAKDKSILLGLDKELKRRLNETRTLKGKKSIRNKRTSKGQKGERLHHLMYENISKTEIIENAMDREFPIQPEKYYVFPPFNCPKGFTLDEARGSLKFNPWNGYLEHKVQKNRLPYRYFHQLKRSINGDHLRKLRGLHSVEKRDKSYNLLRHLKNYFRPISQVSNVTVKNLTDPERRESLRRYYALFPVSDGRKVYKIPKSLPDENERSISRNGGKNFVSKTEHVNQTKVPLLFIADIKGPEVAKEVLLHEQGNNEDLINKDTAANHGNVRNNTIFEDKLIPTHNCEITTLKQLLPVAQMKLSSISDTPSSNSLALLPPGILSLCSTILLLTNTLNIINILTWSIAY